MRVSEFTVTQKQASMWVASFDITNILLRLHSAMLRDCSPRTEHGACTSRGYDDYAVLHLKIPYKARA